MSGLPPGMGAVAQPKPQAQAGKPRDLPPKVEGFAWTEVDVANAVEDLLATLPEPRTDVEVLTRPTIVVALESDKNGKSINSIAVRTNQCRGFPRPENSIVVVLHFDNQCQSSFEYFLASTGVELAGPLEMPHFIRMDAPKDRFVGRVTAEDPGYAAYIKDVFFLLVDRLGKRGDVGLLVVDRGETFVSEYLNDYALWKAGQTEFSSLAPTDWMPRAKVYTDLVPHLETGVVPGGLVVINGPEHKDDGANKTVILPGGARAQKKVKSKWIQKIERNLPVIIHVDEMADEMGNSVWHAEIHTGRNVLFPKGRKADLTNKNIGAFCWPEGEDA